VGYDYVVSFVVMGFVLFFTFFLCLMIGQEGSRPEAEDISSTVLFAPSVITTCDILVP
jgi:hypothetical protein